MPACSLLERHLQNDLTTYSQIQPLVTCDLVAERCTTAQEDRLLNRRMYVSRRFLGPSALKIEAR